jgi:hypothetical protein
MPKNFIKENDILAFFQKIALLFFLLLAYVVSKIVHKARGY